MRATLNGKSSGCCDLRNGGAGLQAHPQSLRWLGRTAPKGAVAFSGGRDLRTAIYVDGFNLYHRALETNPAIKWLDLKAMAAGALRPENRIVRVRYFTARVAAPPNDIDMPMRQDTYIRALKAHIPELTVHFGRFVQRPKTRRLVNPPATGSKYVEVWHREEKGSDVNLAVHLVNDAWRDEYDCAVVVSDDSDLAEALAIARYRNKTVGILTTAGRPTAELDSLCNFYRHLTNTHFTNSQLPDPVLDRDGRAITRPSRWR